MDDVGAIVISFVIVYRWMDIIQDQTDKMVGRFADDEYIDGLISLAKKQDGRIQSVDRAIAYFFGTKYNVELDIMTLEEAHDVGVGVQVMLENQDDVERATVHVSVCACFRVYILTCWHGTHVLALSLRYVAWTCHAYRWTLSTARSRCTWRTGSASRN